MGTLFAVWLGGDMIEEWLPHGQWEYNAASKGGDSQVRLTVNVVLSLGER